MNTEQERAAFEAWYRLHHGSLDVYGRDASGEYADKQVQGAFNVWQARAAQAPAADAQPGYAGVTVWVGDMKCTMEVPKQILKASRCDALLECFQKARHAIDAAPAQPAAHDQGEVQRLREALLAENVRLREALEVMVEMVEMNGFGRDYAMDVARAALAQEGEQ